MPRAAHRLAVASIAPPFGLHLDPADPIERLGCDLAAFTSDVTRREAELSRLVRQIGLERNNLLDSVLNRMFDGFAGFIPFDRVLCSFLTDSGASTVTYWMRSRGSSISIPAGYTSPVADSGLYELIGTNHALIIDDLADYVRQHPSGELLRRLANDGGRSSLTCPLVADGVPLGFLLFVSGETGTYQAGHVAAFERLAGQISIVVQKTRAYGQGLTQGRRLLAERRRLVRQATTDPLTGVLNRRGLDQALAFAWRRHMKGNGTFAIIMCDIDRFKDVNDRHGHATGDLVLSETARRLAQGLRTNDVFGRYGGEEFLALVNTAHEDRVAEVAERLRALVAHLPIGDVRVTASFGAAVAGSFSSVHSLFVGVDRALYSAKQQGRNRCVVSSGDTH